jgi:F-type H+-transporting ATPase subunit b
MKPLFFWTLIIGLLGVAWAAGGGGHGGEAGGAEHHGPPWKEMAFHAVNLVLLMGAIAYFAKDKVTAGLRARALGVRKELEGAEAARTDAQARYDALQSQIAGLEKQLAQMRQDAETESQRERDALVQRAQQEAEQIRQSAVRTLRDETERARQMLRREAAHLAISLASEQAAAQISSDDHNRLTQDFLVSMAGKQEVGHG